MTPFASFNASDGTWQNFYLLVGTAAATLIGLMFIAVTFGSSSLTPDRAEAARAFIDPPFNHFVQILVTACLLLIPTMGPTLLGIALSTLGALRQSAFFRIYRHMAAAHRKHHDLELSDWLMGIAVPALGYLLLIASGAAFLAGYALAFNLLALVTIAILLNGVFGAWELMVWLAIARTREP